METDKSSGRDELNGAATVTPLCFGAPYAWTWW
jgi:hypothetical protein